MEVLINEKINIKVVCPYCEMADYFNGLNTENIKIDAKTINNKSEIQKFIQKNEKNTDVFLSSGSSVSFIRKNTSIPVVNIKITNFDLIKAINSEKIKKDTKIICLSYYKDSFELDEIKSIFKLKNDIIQIKYSIPEDIRLPLQNAKNKGGSLVIGGGCTEEYSDELLLKRILLKSSNEAMNNAIEEAINIVLVGKREREKIARLNTTLNFIKQGIVVTDIYNTVTLCNDAAAIILNLDKNKILDKDISNFIGNNELYSDSTDRVLKINDSMIATSTVDIKVNDTLIGHVNSFDKASTIQKLERKIRDTNHKKGLIAKYNFDNIITKDKKMESLKTLADKYAKTDGTILINGESGTGKELFAQSIHNSSNRREWPFVAVNCGAIHENLLESELFGYANGAFTGAKKEGKMGLFELAHRGTIFLDEIGEMPLSLQASLLRVIQEKEVMRVGSNEVTPIDIRIVCATNRDLREEIAKGNFREDLYYRLNVFNLKVPALRERREDISLISEQLLTRFGVDNKEKVISIIKDCPRTYPWRGNIRELENVIRRLSLLTEFNDFDINDIKYTEFIDSVESVTEEYSLEINLNNTLKNIVKAVEFKIISKLLDDDYTMEEILNKLDISRASYMRKKSQIRD
ncbi:MAG: sigma 54-interacting transcriptional regulator [Sarcina sp.]